MKEKILIAIDSSDSSSKVLAYGINLAGKLDAEVKVVHVIEPYSKLSDHFEPVKPLLWSNKPMNYMNWPVRN